MNHVNDRDFESFYRYVTKPNCRPGIIMQMKKVNSNK